MSHAAFPSGDDLSAFLISEEYCLEAPANADVIAGAVEAMFIRETGWPEFLIEATKTTHRFDPPGLTALGQVLELKRGLLTAETVTVGYTGVGTGTELEEETDYFFEPEDGGTDCNPYTSLSFTRGVGGGQRSIAIYGGWGYTSEIPEDIWLACLQQGAANWMRDQAAGGAQRIKQGPVEIEFGTSKADSKLGQLDGAFRSAVARHMRI